MSDKIIQLNEDLIKHDLKDLVRNSVEETLNALLDKEADELVNAEKYERSSDRQGYRSGHYKRNFHTTAGEVELKVPKLKGISFETSIIERYRLRESSVEEVLIERCLTGVSVRHEIPDRFCLQQSGFFLRNPSPYTGYLDRLQEKPVADQRACYGL